MNTATARNLEQPWWYSRSTPCSPLRPAPSRRLRRRQGRSLVHRAAARAGEVLALAAVLGSFLGSIWLLGS